MSRGCFRWVYRYGCFSCSQLLLIRFQRVLLVGSGPSAAPANRHRMHAPSAHGADTKVALPHQRTLRARAPYPPRTYTRRARREFRRRIDRTRYRCHNLMHRLRISFSILDLHCSAASIWLGRAFGLRQNKAPKCLR